MNLLFVSGSLVLDVSFEWDSAVCVLSDALTLHNIFWDVSLAILHLLLRPSAISLCRYILHFVWYWWTVVCCERPCSSFCLNIGFYFLGCKPSSGGTVQVSLAFEELLGAFHNQAVSRSTSSEWQFQCFHIPKQHLLLLVFDNNCPGRDKVISLWFDVHFPDIEFLHELIGYLYVYFEDSNPQHI